MAFQRHGICSHSNVMHEANELPNWPLMKDKKMTGGDGLTADQLKIATSVFENQYLTLEKLLSIADSYTTIPEATMRDILDDSVQHAGCGVAANIFFNGTEHAYWGGKEYSGNRNDLAISLVSKSMTKVSSFDFNRVTKGNESDAFWKNLIHGKDGAEMGRGLLAEDVFRKGMKEYFDDKNKWLSELEEILQNEVYIIGTIVRQLASQVALPAKMKFFMLQVMGSSKIDQIADKWKSFSSEELVKPVLAFVTTENHLDFVASWLINDPYFNKVQAACTKAFERYYSYSHFTTAYNWTDTHTETTYGKKAAEWICDDSGPKRLSLSTGKGVSDNVSVYCPGGGHEQGGCFLAGTLVLLDHNTDVTIEHLQENDKIVGWHGNLGIVSSEKAGLVLERDWMAFGFNDEEPFFLACHPFWTQDGWRAIDPTIARKENKWLDVGRLTPSDYVRKIKNNDHGNIEYEWVKVQVIKTKMYPAGTQFYGVHTREGPRSYHANGYLVCQNYPEITIQTVVDGLQNVSFIEQKKVQEHLKKLQPSLSKIMGPGPARAILALSEKRIDRHLHPAKQVSKKLYLQDVTYPRLSFIYQSDPTTTSSYSMPTEMAFLKGHLFLAKQYVPIAKFADKQHIMWTRPVPGGMWEHGCIKLFGGGGFTGRGYVCLTRERNATSTIQAANFSVAPSTSIYKHFRGPLKSDPERILANADDEWTDSGELEMGTEGTTLIAKMSILPNLPFLDTLDNKVQFSVDGDDNFIVNVDVPTDYMSFLGYIKFYGVFNWDYQSFSGYCITFDGNDPDFKGETYEWKGEFNRLGPDDSSELLDIARKECLKRSMHNLKQTTDEVAPAPMAYQLMKSTDDDLSVSELFLLTPPDPQEMHDLTFTLIQKVMKYDMDEDDLKNILGTVRPSLNTIEQECADAYPEFFGYRMANAYLMNALSTDSTLEEKFDEVMKNKLLYYWAGNDEGCLSQDADYNLANNKLGRLAYLEKIPRIQDYINSPKGGEQWAKELYDYITTDEKLNSFATLSVIEQDMSKTQKQSMVLYCLTDKPRPENPDQNYAADFYCTVLTKRLGINSEYFDGNEDYQEFMIDIMGDLINGLVDNILAGGDEGTKEIIAAYRQQMQDLADAYGITMQELATEGVEHMINMATDVIHLYFNESGVQWEKLFKSTKKWFDAHPSISKAFNGLSSAISFAFWGLSIMGTLTSFMAWDTLPPEARAVVVLDTIHMALKAFATAGPTILEVFDEACITGLQTLEWIKTFSTAKNSTAILDGYRSLITDGASAIEGIELTTNEAVASAVAKTEGELEVMTSKWGKMFKYAEKAAKLVGVIAGAAACVMIGFQIYRDFVNGAPVAVKVLDIIQGASFAVVTLTSLIGLFVEVECIPVIGQVASIVGIVAMVVLMIIGRDPPKPENPAEVYIDDKGGDYVKGLKEPSQEWLDNYNEQHPDDEPE